ncbi:MAG: tripartite tricarboxylate transporter substrate binding protein [Proteobacteria bacterium]|nr:tripartite tricarboxylate transporter substrate binding protein [Pseudomonadota bacterium]
MRSGPVIGRRTFTIMAASLAVAPTARAETWPTRPVRLVVPFAPGGSTDVTARLIGDQLTRIWGQTVVIDNKPGAGTHLATDHVAKSAPDGYTVLITAATLPIGRSLYRTLPYEISDLAPVSTVVSFPLAILVPASSPLRSVAALIAHAKANPGKLSYASPGQGTTPHLAGELLKQMAGLDMIHVPYRGDGPGLADTMAGRVDLQIAGPALLEHVKGGQVRGLAMTSATRSPLAPELEAVGETVPCYDVTSWFALFVPAKTPRDIVARMSADVGRVTADPAIKARFADITMVAGGSTPEALGALVDAEVKKWAAVIKAANITLE